MSKTIGIEWDEGRFGVRTVGVMLDDKNRVLLYHWEGDDFWVFPGGGITPFLETSKEAIKRNENKFIQFFFIYGIYTFA